MRTLFWSVFLIATSVSAEPPVTDWRVLVPGEYHGDEAPARPGPGLLALVPVGGVWRLEPAIVRATRVHDPVLDAEGDRTGIALTSSRSDTFVLLRLPDLQPGKVDTPALKFSGGARLISLGEAPLKLKFRSDEYVIEGRKARLRLKPRLCRVRPAPGGRRPCLELLARPARNGLLHVRPVVRRNEGPALRIHRGLPSMRAVPR